MKTRKKITNILAVVILSVFFIVCVYPVVWMVAGSFKNNSEFYTNIWGFTMHPQFQNYAVAWKQGALGEKFWNSILVTACSIAIMIPVNSCAAYVIGRMEFKGRMLIYSILLLGIMIPGGVLGIPTFQVLLGLGLNNSRVGLILVYVAGSIAMGVFIMRSFFISLPKGLEEAAMIDGCTRFQSFRKIILPLAKPGIATQVIFSGLSFWNEYYFANMLLSKPELRTLPVAAANFIGRHGVDYPVLFAALTIITVPVILLYIFAQRGFVEGLASGAMKG